MFSLFFEVFGKNWKSTWRLQRCRPLGERFVSSRFGHLVIALLVAEWDEWDKRPAGSLRSIQFIQFNWTKRSGDRSVYIRQCLFNLMKNGLNDSRSAPQILSICWKMGWTHRSAPQILFHLLNFGVIFQKMCLNAEHFTFHPPRARLYIVETGPKSI